MCLMTRKPTWTSYVYVLTNVGNVVLTFTLKNAYLSCIQESSWNT
jgi:hypothetical protein